MYVIEKQNICDSVLFLLAARETLCNIYESTEDFNFIKNEASDYQIMNLLLRGSLPESKYNVNEELKLFSEFKESMLINTDFLTEMVGKDIFNNLLNEVDSLHNITSTAKSIIEFTSINNSDVRLAYNIYRLNESGESIDISIDTVEKLIRKAHKMLTSARARGDNSVTRHIQKKLEEYHDELNFLRDRKKSMISNVAKKGPAADAGGVKAAHLIGGAAVAAAAIYAGYKIYKRFFSQAARACKGKSGSVKTLCMNKYKKTALTKQASAIQSGAAKCSKSKDPAKCKAAINKKIKELRAKASLISA